jgi:beta-fructofuranosidase
VNEILEQNKQYNENNKEEKDIYRPSIHFTPRYGWMNDPNGFISYKGKYHLFYQYHPYDTVWGPMHWGHAVSDDLIQWSHMPIALSPDKPYDVDGCFSGSAMEREGKLYLIYTGNVFLNSSKNLVRQTQCVAISDNGFDFDKYVDNPIIKNERFIEDMSIFDFRDPRVIKWADRYLCLVGSKTEENLGQFLLFESADLIHWGFKSVMLKGDKSFGTMWECPDMFHIDGKDVIIMSSTAMLSQKERFRNVNSSIWMIGNFDLEHGKFTMEKYGEIDHGFDFYAPQAIASPDGKRIMISWMEIWDHTMPTHEMGLEWTGAMTIPRELSIRNNELIQQPVSNIDHYCKLVEEVNELHVENFHKTFKLKTGMRIKCKIKVWEDMEIKIQIYTKESENALFIYRNNEMILHREGSPFVEEDYRKTDVLTVNGMLDMDLILDRSALEAFFDQGRRTMSARLYPKNTGAFIQIDINQSTTIHKLQCFSI